MSPQNSVALASIQLPPSLFSTLPAALAPPVPPDCTLQLLVFRNGRLFRSHSNTSRPGAAGPGKRRGVATPVIFAGTSKGLTSCMSAFSLSRSVHGSLLPWYSWQRVAETLEFLKEGGSGDGL